MQVQERPFDEVIQLFLQEGAKIEGVYDLLIRGSASQSERRLVPHYSDLDTSIVVEEVHTNVLKQVKTLYRALKKIFPYKISITVVSKSDFLSDRHHHGIKPIYYSSMLDSAVSLLQKESPKRSAITLEQLQFDCLSNIAYLIHDLRSKYILLDSTNSEEMREFFCHLLKRAKHLSRNAIFILTGHYGEEINDALFKECFSCVDSDFPALLKCYKANFEIINTSEEIEAHIERVLNVLEKMHDALLMQIGSANNPRHCT